MAYPARGQEKEADRHADRVMLSGGCFCGQVRYQTDGAPFHETLCHCRDCRRVSGAPAVAWFTVRRDTLRYTKGTPVRFRSSARATRSFCASCGTPLAFEALDHPGEIDVATCTLDDPDALPPKSLAWSGSRLLWMHPDRLLPLPDETSGPEAS